VLTPDRGLLAGAFVYSFLIVGVGIGWTVIILHRLLLLAPENGG
jgi:hypothetical protein